MATNEIDRGITAIRELAQAGYTIADLVCDKLPEILPPEFLNSCREVVANVKPCSLVQGL